MLTNKQMFGNQLSPIEYQADIEQYDHKILHIPDKWQLKLVLIFAVGLLIYCIISTIWAVISPLFEVEAVDELGEFEGLNAFSKSLSKKDARFWADEEKMNRKKLGYKYLFDNFYDRLKERVDNFSNFETEDPSTERSIIRKYINDATNYDVIYQPEYAHSFSYIPAFKRFDAHSKHVSSSVRIDFKDSQFTRKVLDYPYHRNNTDLKSSLVSLNLGDNNGYEEFDNEHREFKYEVQPDKY